MFVMTSLFQKRNTLEPLALQPRCPVSISLFDGFFVVLTTVNFDDDLLFETYEINDVLAYRLLSPELEACQPVTPESGPKRPFSICRVFTKLSVKGYLLFVSQLRTHYLTLTLPSPIEREGGFRSHVGTRKSLGFGTTRY